MVFQASGIAGDIGRDSNSDRALLGFEVENGSRGAWDGWREFVKS